MKSLRLLIALLFILISPATLLAQGWEHVYPETEINDLKDAVWFNGDTAYVCGNNWTLLQTVNGGVTWENVLHGEYDFDIIRITTDGNRVFFSTTYPEWHRYTAADDSLVPFFAFHPRTGTLEDLSFDVGHGGGTPFQADWLPPVQVSENYLYNEMLYLPGEVYRMDIRTNEWSPIPYPGQIMASAPLSDDVYFYVGIQPPDYNMRFAFLTSDQGTTWQIDTIAGLNADHYAYDLAAVPNGSATRFILSERYTVQVSDDTGKTWQETVDIPWQTRSSPYIMSVSALTAEHWYILGREGGVYETRDAGQTWIQLKESEALSGMSSLMGDMRVMTTNDRGGLLIPRQKGWITQSENGGITWDERLRPKLLAIMRMHFFTPNEGLLIGYENSQSTLFATTDGGESWETTGPVENSIYGGLSSLDSFDEIYSFKLLPDSIVGARFEQYRSTDQGRSWEFLYQSEVGSNARYLRVFDEVYVITLQNDADLPGMFVSDDRGRSWSFYPTQQLLIPRDMQCGRDADGNAVYYMIPSVPKAALLFRSQDGCRTWKPWYSGSITNWDKFDELDVTSDDTLALRSEQTLHITTSGRTGFKEYPVPRLEGNPRQDAEYIYLWPEILAVKRSLYVAGTDNNWATHTVQLAKSSHAPAYTNWFILDRNHIWLAAGVEIWRTSTGGVNWVRTAPDVPEGFGIASVYPNPVSVGSAVSIQIPTVGAQRAVPVRVSVYDLLGREVAVLYEGRGNDVNHMLTWNTAALHPGMYYITTTAGSARSVRPIAVVR